MLWGNMQPFFSVTRVQICTPNIQMPFGPLERGEEGLYSFDTWIVCSVYG